MAMGFASVEVMYDEITPMLDLLKGGSAVAIHSVRLDADPAGH